MTTLYCGLSKPLEEAGDHCPLIAICPRAFETQLEILKAIPFSSHFIFTSKQAVKILHQIILWGKVQFPEFSFSFAVGLETAQTISRYFPKTKIIVAREFTAEGVAELLHEQKIEKGHFFWGHAAGARPVLFQELRELTNKNWLITYTTSILYDTITAIPEKLPNLGDYQKIVFTSPSTVRAFWEIFGPPPSHLELVALGPITQKCLDFTQNRIKKKNALK